MKYRLAAAAALAIALSNWTYASDPAVIGDYVEARTAQVYTGGCIMGSEGEVSGREAILAWRVSQGRVNGVALDGLAVVAVVAGDSNLGTHELGGRPPTTVKAILMTDDRATAEQQRALVTMARSLAPDVVREVVATKNTSITFQKTNDSIQVAAGPARLDVVTNVEHSPSCGAAKWFGPLARTRDAKVGQTKTNEWSGSGLNTEWKQLDRTSSYFGSFSYER
jgi:hypothetical protein